MPAFAGQLALVQQAVCGNPATLIYTSPANSPSVIAGYAFTNPNPTPDTVVVYRDAAQNYGRLFTVTVPGGAVGWQWPSYLRIEPGQSLYAFSQSGLTLVEVDGQL